MNKFMKVLKNGRIGKICRISAIIIALIGVAHVALQLYSTWMAYQVLQSQSGQPIGPPSFTIEYYTYLMPTISSTLQTVATTIFYVVVLYTAGVVINARFGPAQNEEPVNKEDETAITYEPLDDAEMLIESIDKRRSKG